MTDKTCGSCINLMRDCIEDQNGYVGGACRASLVEGKYRYVNSADECTEPLDLYEECTDSLEQWARDIIDSYARLYSNVSICDNRNNLRKACGNPSSYFKRLKTLGVSL